MSNLLPYKTQSLIRRLRTLRGVCGLLCLIIAVAIAALLLLMPASKEIKAHYAVAHAAAVRYEAAGSFVASKDIVDATHSANALASILAPAKTFSPVDAMQLLNAAVPHTVSITQYSVNTASPVLVISGTATTRSALQSFVEVLQRSNFVASVDSPVDNYVKNNNPAFTMTVTFK
jgi:hypothetical protein